MAIIQFLSMENHILLDTPGMLGKIEEVLNSSGRLVLEIPPEIEVKVRVISFILNYLRNKSFGKLIICASHLNSIDKISKFIHYSNPEVNGIILSSNIPYCTNFSSFSLDDISIEKKCKDSCFTDDYKAKVKNLPSPGILTLTEILKISEANQLCPYLHTKTLLAEARIIFCSQNYYFRKGLDLINPIITQDIILFEESINLDTLIADVHSSSINLRILSAALKGIEEIIEKIQENTISFEIFSKNCKNGTLKDFASND